MCERTVRILLVGLGVPAAVIGAWAAFAPRSFYEDFPGFGQLWVRPDGPFNEHLVRDFGQLNLALAFVTLAAAVWCTPLLARLIAGAWLVEGIPHLVYHVRHLDQLASDAKVASIASLVVVPVVALVILARSRIANGEVRRSVDRLRAWSHRDDDLSSSVPIIQVADGRGNLAERVGLVDDGRDVAGLDELGEHEQVGVVLRADERRQLLADER